MCKALETGVAALFGPQSSSTASHIQSICDALEIPHVETRWDFKIAREDYSVNLYPHPEALGKVISMITHIHHSYFDRKMCSFSVAT